MAITRWHASSNDIIALRHQISWNSTGPTRTRTPTLTSGMHLSCNFVKVYTIAYRVQYTFTRVHARIHNGHPREEKRTCRTSRRTSRRGSSCVSGSWQAERTERGSRRTRRRSSRGSRRGYPCRCRCPCPCRSHGIPAIQYNIVILNWVLCDSSQPRRTGSRLDLDGLFWTKTISGSSKSRYGPKLKLAFTPSLLLKITKTPFVGEQQEKKLHLPTTTIRLKCCTENLHFGPYRLLEEPEIGLVQNRPSHRTN